MVSNRVIIVLMNTQKSSMNSLCELVYTVYKAEDVLAAKYRVGLHTEIQHDMAGFRLWTVEETC